MLCRIVLRTMRDNKNTVDHRAPCGSCRNNSVGRTVMLCHETITRKLLLEVAPIVLATFPFCIAVNFVSTYELSLDKVKLGEPPCSYLSQRFRSKVRDTHLTNCCTCTTNAQTLLIRFDISNRRRNKMIADSDWTRA